jgi:hypothetical protein
LRARFSYLTRLVRTLKRIEGLAKTSANCTCLQLGELLVRGCHSAMKFRIIAGIPRKSIQVLEGLP